nr:fatty acid desaturase [Kribbella monticola]
MADETAPPAIARGTYRELRSLVRQAGLLEPRTGYYVRRIGTNLLAFALGVLLFAAAGDSWWQVPIAAYLAIVTSQMAMIGHDAGHRQISRSRRANNVLGYLHLNLAAGVSHGWWNERHRKHHAHPNDPRFDPDISNSVIVLWADERRLWTGRSWVSKYQAVYFFPLLFLAQGFALHFSHFKNLSKLPGRAVLIESALLAVHVAGYCSALMATMSPLKIAAFTMVNQGIRCVYHRDGCSESQRNACLAGRGADGLPPAPDGDRPEHPWWSCHRARVRRPELSDRAPPLPDHAGVLPEEGEAHRRAVLPGARAGIRRDRPRRVVLGGSAAPCGSDEPFSSVTGQPSLELGMPELIDGARLTQDAPPGVRVLEERDQPPRQSS